MNRIERDILWSVACVAAATMLAGAALHAFANQAGACICPSARLSQSERMEVAWEQAESIFAGEVASISTHKVRMFSNEREDIVEFNVARIWKGYPYETIFVKRVYKRTRDFLIFKHIPPCGGNPPFAEGETYLVFVYDGEADLGMCSLTNLLNHVPNSIPALGPGEMPESASIGIKPALTQKFPVALMELGIFAVIGLIIAPFIWSEWRNRSPI